MHFFRGATADKVWRKAYKAFFQKPICYRMQPSRGGDTIELLHVVIEITDPSQRWISSRKPALNPAFAIAESLWILAGSNDANVLNYWFPRLPEFQGTGPVYPGAYGYRLRSQFGFNQIQQACEALSINPSSRQVVLQIWDCTKDLPLGDGVPRCSDIPCNVISLLKVRENRLEWTQIMRSTDLLRGLPHNIIQFTILQEMMAGWLELKPGSFHLWSDSLHIYKKDLAKINCGPAQRLEQNSDSLAISQKCADTLILNLYERMVELIADDLDEQHLVKIVSIPNAPISYQNLMLVLGAESARKRERFEQALSIISECTNPQLRQVWLAWLERTNSARRP